MATASRAPTRARRAVTGKTPGVKTSSDDTSAADATRAAQDIAAPDDTPVPQETPALDDAPARKRPGPKPGSRSRKRIVFSAALLEDCRRRYEETADTVIDIAADAGVDEKVIRRVARENAWERYIAPPLDLTPSAQLLRDVATFERRRFKEGADAKDTATLDGFEADIQAQRTELARQRATAPGDRKVSDDVRITRDHVAIYEKIRRMRAMPTDAAEAAAYVPFDEDDRYATIDAFRDEIARRIAAFIDGRNAAKDAGGDA